MLWWMMSQPHGIAGADSSSGQLWDPNLCSQYVYLAGCEDMDPIWFLKYQVLADQHVQE